MESTLDYASDYSAQPPNVGGCLIKLIGLLLVLGVLGIFAFGVVLGSLLT